MKKSCALFMLSLSLCLVLSTGASAANVTLSAQRLTVDGREIACERYNIDGSNYFKLRDIAYLLANSSAKFSVGYDAEKGLVTVLSGQEYEPTGTELKLGEDKSAQTQPSGQRLLVNGREREGLTVYNIGGNNFFKLRDLGDMLGFEVDYDVKTNTAVISNKSTSYAEPGQSDIEGWYAQGKAAYDAKDYGPAVYFLGKAAVWGHAEAQHCFGLCYDCGYGLLKSSERAFEWYLKAAEQGVTECEFNVGVMYDYGMGVAQSHAEAARWYRRAADKGLDAAQTNLGWLYENGWGVQQDYAKAAELYRKAVEQGDPLAQNNLGHLYLNGWGVEQNFSLAVEYLQKAAKQNVDWAFDNLGLCCENGWGVTQSYAKAAEYYRKACDLGLADAQYRLALLYLDGKGVGKNEAEAAALFRKAAEQGNAEAQYRLGLCYESGIGVTRSREDATKWYRLSAEQGYVPAQEKMRSR